LIYESRVQLSVTYTRGTQDDQFTIYADNEVQGGFNLPAMLGTVKLNHTFMLLTNKTDQARVTATYRANDQIDASV